MGSDSGTSGCTGTARDSETGVGRENGSRDADVINNSTGDSSDDSDEEYFDPEDEDVQSDSNEEYFDPEVEDVPKDSRTQTCVQMGDNGDYPCSDPVVENVIIENESEKLSNDGNVSGGLSSVENVREELSNVENVSEELSSVENVREELSNVENVSEELSNVEQELQPSDGHLPTYPYECQNNELLSAILQDSNSNQPRVVAHNVDNLHSGHRFDFHFNIFSKEGTGSLTDPVYLSSLLPSNVEDTPRERSPTTTSQLSDTSRLEKCEELFNSFQENLRSSYRQESSYMPSFHWRQGEHVLSIKHYYVLPEISETDGNIKLRSGVPLEELFACDHKGTMPPKRILLIGESGAGKTSLFTKLAYDWSNLEHSVNYLANYSAIVIINLRKLITTSLEEELTTRILASVQNNEQNFTVEEALVVIKENAKNLLILLDGCDEYFAEEEILNLMSARFCKSLQWINYTTIVLSSRPLAAKKITRLFQRCLQLEGFSPSQKETFAERYFGEEKMKYHSFLRYLNNETNIASLGRNPLMLTLICLLHEKNSLESFLGRGEVNTFGVCYSFLYLLMHSTLSEHDVEIQENKLSYLFSEAFRKLGTISVINMMNSECGQVYDVDEDNSIELTLLKDMGILKKSSCNQYDTCHSTFVEYSVAFALSNVTDVEKIAQFLANFCLKLHPDLDSIDAGKYTLNTDKGEVKYRILHLDSVIQIVTYMEGMLDGTFPLLIQQLKNVSFLCSTMKEYFPHASLEQVTSTSNPLNTVQELQSMPPGSSDHSSANEGPQAPIVQENSECNTTPSETLPKEINCSETTFQVHATTSASLGDLPECGSVRTCPTEFSCPEETRRQSRSVPNTPVQESNHNERINNTFNRVLLEQEKQLKVPTKIDELSINFNDITDTDLWRCHMDTLQSEDFIVQSVRVIWHKLPDSNSQNFQILCNALESSQFLDIIILQINTDFTVLNDPESEAESHCEVVMRFFKLNLPGGLDIHLGKCFEHNSSVFFVSILNDFIKKANLRSARRRDYTVTDGIKRNSYLVQCQNE